MLCTHVYKTYTNKKYPGLFSDRGATGGNFTISYSVHDKRHVSDVRHQFPDILICHSNKVPD